jgi:signal transduction histidine kinase
MQTKYETEKKEKENIKLQGDVKQRMLQRNIFMASAIALLLLAAGLFFFFRQKQQIALRNDHIQKQQIGELLNTQEIKSLNAMMEGQEKERKRIAEDLHDRVGSSLAAIKLHMNSVARIFNITEDGNDQFYRVNTMFDDVVKEVRQVSHDLASGVLMKFGLVPALRDLCESIESAGRQKVTLITHGMDERLDNQTEIILYRVAQECIGNILKHADAGTIGIQLTRHDQSFMLMIEDDGIGFDPQKVKSDGMGLAKHSFPRGTAPRNSAFRFVARKRHLPPPLKSLLIIPAHDTNHHW